MDTSLDVKKTDIQIQRQVPLEAISKALYLVTDLIEKSEPLRQSLRTLSIELLLVEDKGQRDVRVLQLSSLIKIARETKLISEMNSELLLKALSGVVAPNDTDKDVSVAGVLEESGSEGIENKTTIHVLNTTKAEVIKKDTMTNVVFDKKPSPIVSTQKITNFPEKSQNSGSDVGSRRKKILEIVRSKGQATINEFIDEIQGCSSKTIQRELTSLVLSGTLKKAGERRWSKYSLK